MIDKTYEIKVKIGEYMKNGKPVGKYATIGRVMPGHKGEPFASLDPAYLSMQILYMANPDRKDSILANMYEPYNSTKQSSHYEAKSNGYQPQPTEVKEEPLDDDIPY